jgi:hypothetical protein
MLQLLRSLRVTFDRPRPPVIFGYPTNDRTNFKSVAAEPTLAESAPKPTYLLDLSCMRLKTQTPPQTASVAFDEAVDRWRSERDQVSVVNESQAKEQEGHCGVLGI